MIAYIVQCKDCLYWDSGSSLLHGHCECIPEEWLELEDDSAVTRILTSSEDYCSLGRKKKGLYEVYRAGIERDYNFGL